MNKHNICESGNLVEIGESYCEEEKCQSCCPHDEFDQCICLACDYEKCPGEDIDAAEYTFGGDR